MSPSSGIFWSVRRSLSSSRPPNAMISRSFTVTVVFTSRLLMMSSLKSSLTGPTIELTSWRMSSLTWLPALICGFTSSSMPTFWRWMVRKALSKLFDSASPVLIGISWPNRIDPFTLSFTVSDGVDRMFDSLSSCTALMIAPSTRLLPISAAKPE